MKELSDQDEQDIYQQLEKFIKGQFRMLKDFSRCEIIRSNGPIIIAPKFDPIDEQIESGKYSKSILDAVE